MAISSLWKQIETIIPTSDTANMANKIFAFRLFVVCFIKIASTNITKILSDIAIADIYNTHCSTLLIVLLISNIGETLHFYLHNAYIYYTTLLNICQKCLNFLYYFISNVQCYIWFYSCRESYITTIFFN